MIKSRYTKAERIQGITPRRRNPSTAKTNPITNNFPKGINTMKSNNIVDMHELLLAQDARMTKFGEYETRRGFNLFTDAIGKAIAYNQLGTNNTTLQVSDQNVIRQQFTATSNFRLWQIDLNARAVNAFGTITVDIYTDNSGNPDRRIGSTTIDQLKLSGTLSTVSANFVEAPDLINGSNYWIIIAAQQGCTGNFDIGIATAANTIYISSNGGKFWTTTTGKVNFRLQSATAAGIDSIFVAKTGSTVTTFFATGGKLYRSDVTGNVTLQNGSLPGGTGKMYFDQTSDSGANPTVRYAYSTGLPRKINLNTFAETSISTARGNAWNVLRHGGAADGYLFYMSSLDPNGVYTSSSVSYDADNFDISQTFVGEIPAPMSGDDLKAMESLSGTLFFFTRRHKYALMGTSWQTFSLSNAAGDKGTFSQDSIVADTNYIYYATDTGIMRFNGSAEIDLTGDDKNPGVQNYYGNIVYKDSIVLDIHDNKLFVFWSDTADHANNHCMVYNLNLNIWESFDTDTYVGATFARQNPQNKFVVGHSRVGALMVAEDSSNNYNNLGAPVHFLIGEPTRPYGTPSQLKRITKWRPLFLKANGNYSVDCGYMFDTSDTVNYAFSMNLNGGGVKWDSGVLWDAGTAVWGSDNGANFIARTTKPSVYSEWYQAALYYRHFAAFEPVHFIDHTITLETQRLR